MFDISICFIERNVAKKCIRNPKKKRKSDSFIMKRKRAHVPYESPKSGNLEYFTRNRI